jgi:hypothetical protein
MIIQREPVMSVNLAHLSHVRQGKKLDTRPAVMIYRNRSLDPKVP